MIPTTLNAIMRRNQLLAKKIRRARREAGLKAHDLAARLNVTPLYIDLVESGRCTITDNLIEKIAEVTAQPVSFFDLTQPVTKHCWKTLDQTFAEATRQEAYYNKCREFAEKIREHERRERDVLK